MAAMLKYIDLADPSLRFQLQEGGHAKDHAQHNEDTSKGTEEEPPPERSSSTKDSNIRIMARLEANRGAYLSLTPADNFDTALYTSVQILSGSTNTNGTSGTATFRIKFPPQYCNKFGTVHGGALATLLDGVAQCSTAVVDAGMNDAIPRKTKDRGRRGVGATKGIQVNYLKSLELGETVKIVCEVLKAGARGATIRCTVRRETDGEILAVCIMEKEGCDRAKL